MEVLSAFSIADFLAYLFPGIMSLGGIYLLLCLTPMQYLIQPPEDVGAWLAVLVISYIVGIFISTLTEMFFRRGVRSKRIIQNKGNIQIHDEKLKLVVIEAFNELIFNQTSTSTRKTKKLTAILEWNEDCYYICRSLVTEMMPRSGANGLREGAFRQLRMNLIGSIVIWGCAGILWGWKILSQASSIYQIYGNDVLISKEWGYLLIILSLFTTILLVVFQRKLMDRHEQREVREILTSFLAGYSAGIFNKRDK